MSFISRFGIAVKAAATSFVMSFGRAGTGWGGWGGWNWGARDGLAADYTRTVGTGRNNSIVASTLGWLGRKFPNGVLSMRKVLKDGTKELLPAHPMLALLRRPNDFYSGSTMLVAALADWTITGNAYLIKIRNGLGRPIQLWYAPSALIEPVSDDPTMFVQHYRYAPGDREHKLRPEDVIHIRNGIDPENVRKGLSPLASVVREVFTDEEASVYKAAMLKNSGIPRVVISPESNLEMPPGVAEEIKETYTQRFSGPNRGAPMVLTSPIKVTPLSFNPKEMDVSSLQDTAEERITARLGLPAVVVGMGAGLNAATYSNLASLREVAIEDNLLPTYYVFAETLHSQLLPDFETNPDQFELYFDVSGIRELQPDQDKLTERAVRELAGGLATLDEARAMVGKDVMEQDAGKVVYIPINIVPTPLDAIVPVALPAPTPLRAVAGLRGAPEVKSLGVMESTIALRTRLLGPETRSLARVLTTQRDLVVDALPDVVKGLDFVGLETKEIDLPGLARRLETVFVDGMRAFLSRLHLRAAGGVHELVSEWAEVDIPIDAALRARYLRTAGANIAGITDYTLDALSKTIRASVEAGETLEETTERIRDLHVFSDARAEIIARTELSIATNGAAIESFKLSGVVTHVRVHDGREHDEPCASLAGQVLTLEKAAGIPVIQHPRCSRSFEPLRRGERRSMNGNGHVEEKELVLA